MAPFEPKYTDEQREAAAWAVVDDGVKPARRVVEMAKAGTLLHNGHALPAFDITATYVRDLAAAERKRRAGHVTKEQTIVPPRDAVEGLRRRLIAWADKEMRAMEKAQRDGKPGDWDRLRQAIRATRELAALPEPGDPRPPAPGKGSKAERVPGETRSGPVAAMLRDHRGQTAAHHPTGDSGDTNAQGGGETLAPDTTTTETASIGATIEEQNEQDTGTPGAWAQERIARLRMAQERGSEAHT